MSQLMRLWYLSHWRPANVLASLRIRAVSPEPSLFANLKYGRRQRVRQKHQASSLTGWLRMRVWRMRVRRTKRVIISWHDLCSKLTNDTKFRESLMVSIEFRVAKSEFRIAKKKKKKKKKKRRVSSCKKRVSSKKRTVSSYRQRVSSYWKRVSS